MYFLFRHSELFVIAAFCISLTYIDGLRLLCWIWECSEHAMLGIPVYSGNFS